MANTTLVKTYEQWAAEQKVDIEVTIDVGDERAFSSNFFDLDDMEASWFRMQRAITNSLREQYNSYFEEATSDDETE